jgi:hypothetical protein
MVLISEKSGRRPLFDRVPERHNRKYTEPVAMSMRIAAPLSAPLALMREARSVFAGIGFAITTMLLFGRPASKTRWQSSCCPGGHFADLLELQAAEQRGDLAAYREGWERQRYELKGEHGHRSPERVTQRHVSPLSLGQHSSGQQTAG